MTDRTEAMDNLIARDADLIDAQPTQNNIFSADDVQKHTLIVDPNYIIYTVQVKSLDDSQPTQSDDNFRNLPLNESFERVAKVAEERAAFNEQMAILAALEACWLEIKE